MAETQHDDSDSEERLFSLSYFVWTVVIPNGFDDDTDDDDAGIHWTTMTPSGVSKDCREKTPPEREALADIGEVFFPLAGLVTTLLMNNVPNERVPEFIRIFGITRKQWRIVNQLLSMPEFGVSAHTLLDDKKYRGLFSSILRENADFAMDMVDRFAMTKKLLLDSHDIWLAFFDAPPAAVMRLFDKINMSAEEVIAGAGDWLWQAANFGKTQTVMALVTHYNLQTVYPRSKLTAVYAMLIAVHKPIRADIISFGDLMGITKHEMLDCISMGKTKDAVSVCFELLKHYDVQIVDTLENDKTFQLFWFSVWKTASHATFVNILKRFGIDPNINICDIATDGAIRGRMNAILAYGRYCLRKLAIKSEKKREKAAQATPVRKRKHGSANGVQEHNKKQRRTKVPRVLFVPIQDESVAECCEEEEEEEIPRLHPHLSILEEDEMTKCGGGLEGLASLYRDIKTVNDFFAAGGTLLTFSDPSLEKSSVTEAQAAFYDAAKRVHAEFSEAETTLVEAEKLRNIETLRPIEIGLGAVDALGATLCKSKSKVVSLTISITKEQRDEIEQLKKSMLAYVEFNFRFRPDARNLFSNSGHAIALVDCEGTVVGVIYPDRRDGLLYARVPREYKGNVQTLIHIIYSLLPNSIANFTAKYERKLAAATKK